MRIHQSAAGKGRKKGEVKVNRFETKETESLSQDPFFEKGKLKLSSE